MDYKDIIRNIKSKNFENIYLLYGREYYLIDNVILDDVFVVQNVGSSL